MSIEYFDNIHQNLDKLQIESISDFNFYVSNFLNEQNNQTKTFFENLTKKNKEREKEKYEKWRVQYKEEQQLERKKNKVKYVIIAISILMLVYVGKLFYTGDYKFLGHKTSFINAVVYDTGWHHYGAGFYYQKLFFEYKYNNTIYKDVVIIGRRIGKKEVGDSIRLKISKSDPKNYEIKSYFSSQ